MVLQSPVTEPETNVLQPPAESGSNNTCSEALLQALKAGRVYRFSLGSRVYRAFHRGTICTADHRCREVVAGEGKVVLPSSTKAAQRIYKSLGFNSAMI